MPDRKLPKIKMLVDLHDPKYHDLAISAAKNLGGWQITSFDKAYAWLTTCAMETSEDGVIDEVNFCR
jgi:hypothetical protein